MFTYLVTETIEEATLGVQRARSPLCETMFKVLFRFFPFIQLFAKLHSHTTFLTNKYMSTTDKQLPHFIYKTKINAQTQIKIVINL